MKGVYAIEFFVLAIFRLLLCCELAVIAAADEANKVAFAPSTSTTPLKIIVMVGQSNMQGHGHMDATDETTGKFLNGTLEWMVETYPCTYGKLKGYDEQGNGFWKERHDVFITYNRQRVEHVRPEVRQFGPLTAGYGGDGGLEVHEIGPELGFGWTVGDALKEDGDGGEDGYNILLLKVGWGGRALAVEYRPPSSGGDTGLWYEAMLANVYKVLLNLPDLVPGYTSDRGYEIVGFAWHQGWNDGCNEDQVEEYESNLANLIRDVRTDLGIPDLPFSIGVSGMNGWNGNDRRTRIIEAQMAVADPQKYPEFEGTVASVETRDFFRDKPDSPGDQIYHWNNNCESYWLIGEAMGKAMVGLLRNKNNKNKQKNKTPSTETMPRVDTYEKRGRGETMLRGKEDGCQFPASTLANTIWDTLKVPLEIW